MISSVSNKLEGFNRLLPDAETALTEAFEGVKTLKKANCPMWKDIWKRYGECLELFKYIEFTDWHPHNESFEVMIEWLPHILLTLNVFSGENLSCLAIMCLLSNHSSTSYCLQHVYFEVCYVQSGTVVYAESKVKSKSSPFL